MLYNNMEELNFQDQKQNIESTPNNNKSSDYLYLEKLQFRPELRKSWLNFFITKFRVVILLIILMTVWGIYSFTKLPLESQPEVKIPIAVVMTSYQGASPSDIEELITKKIESKVSGIKDIKDITSSSANSISTITVEFNASADLKDSIRNLRDEVNNVKSELPSDASDPIVKEISFDDSPIFTMSLAGPYDGFTLRTYAEEIQSELEKIKGVREVSISGGDMKEFEIAYDPQKLTFYNISPDQANQIVKATNLVFPAGIFEGDKYSYPIRTDSRFYTADKLGNIPIFHSDTGAIVYLRDLAEVKETAIKKTVLSRASLDGKEPRNSITISIIKKTGGSIVETADLAKAKVAEMTKNLPDGITYNISLDTSDMIKKNFNQLKHDFYMTIALVFIILLAVIGLKEALVAGLAVPLVFFVTFGVMLFTGITLNFLSMFSLILALGLLVDDAIVVVSATKQYLRTGKFTPEEAVLLVLNDFKLVLTTTTLTTVWAFLPLLLSTGIMGEFLKSIPITVSVTLIASLIIALIINHPLAAVLERVRLTPKIFWVCSSVLLLFGIAVGLTNSIVGYIIALLTLIILILIIKWYFRGGKIKLKENFTLIQAEWKDDNLIKKKLYEQGHAEQKTLYQRLLHGIFSINLLLPYYEKYLTKLISTKKTRKMTLGIVFALFLAAVSMPLTGIVKQEFFPTSDYEYLWINITMPVGTNLSETDKITKQVEEKLLKYSEIKNFSTIVGGGGSQYSFGSSGSNSSHKSSITITLKDKEERKLKSYDLAKKFRSDFSDIAQAEIAVTEAESGPPSGSAFEAQISGEDLQTLDKIAKDLKPYLASIKGVVSPDISLKESPADYTFTLDPARMELYSLNAASVGSTLRMAISGVEVTNVIIEGEEIEVVANFADDKIPNLSSIQNIQILNNKNQPVYLRDVAKIELKPSVESISRINQKRTVLLSSDVDSSNNSSGVVTEFQKKIKDYKLPSGYEISYGGQNQENTESVISILVAMIVAFVLIFSTMIIQFNSFRKAFIVLATIPLALIGVFFGLAIARLSLSFPGLIGIVALFGIVVKNAIILIDKINLNLKTGIPFQAAVIDAGKSRLEAILITSICTIVGIIPITFSNETWMGFGGAIIFGLMLSSFLTLFVVPVLFVSLIKEGERN